MLEKNLNLDLSKKTDGISFSFYFFLFPSVSDIRPFEIFVSRVEATSAQSYQKQIFEADFFFLFYVLTSHNFHAKVSTFLKLMLFGAFCYVSCVCVKDNFPGKTKTELVRHRNWILIFI